MAKSDVLARVRKDLALGRTYIATRRLRTLLAVYPNDLEVYRMLAAVYRQTGNVVEAGRWAFLTDDLRKEELIAFERAHPSPWLRLRSLRWDGNPNQLSSAARERLSVLTDLAEKVGPPERYVPSTRKRRLGNVLACLFVITVLLVLAGLFGLGLFRVVDWIIH